jgi:hypothetical protein
MKKQLIAVMLLAAATLTIPTGCKKENDFASDHGSANTSYADRGAHAGTYSATVANTWMKLQVRIMATTSGIPNVAFSRHYAYSSIALYESVLPGMPSYQTLVGQLTDLPAMPEITSNLEYHWASSANAALAFIIKHMFPTTSAANIYSIDSLENVFNTQFSSASNAAIITRSVNFGKAVAQIVYDWSLTDGNTHASDPYSPPTGPGLWVPTPPAFAAASTPYWGNVRRMVSGSGNNADPAAPIAYSEAVGSDFYNIAKQVYDASQALTAEQTAMAIFWRDLPGVSTPGHYLSILEQTLETEHPSLEIAAMAYALCSITVYDAAVSTWQSKYAFNLVRPITYIRNVLGHTTWNSLLTTPAHPEYSSAHASLSAANADALESIFGSNYSFTDHTHDYLGIAPRTFSSFRACGEDAGNSRLYAGIHYQPSIDLGLLQGRTIAQNILHTLILKKP